MIKRTAIALLERIEVHLEYPYHWNNAIAPVNQLLLFLRFCASGSYIVSVADLVGVHKSTASRIVERVSRATDVSKIHQNAVEQ
nr:unnamed protein product [Callosobruchus analis]